MCTFLALLTLCKLLYSRALKLFHLSCHEILCLLTSNFHSPSLGPLATTILLSYAVSVTTLDISFKTEGLISVFVFLWLTYFSQHFLQVHSCGSICHGSFFLGLNRWNYIFFIYLLMDIYVISTSWLLWVIIIKHRSANIIFRVLFSVCLDINT